MFLKEFETHKEKFEKIQTYLRENYKFEIAQDKMTASKADRLIERAETKLNSIDQFANPKEYSKLKLISEGLKVWKLTEQEATNNMEEARVILAAEEISTKLQGIVEDVAELQVQKLIPIIDAMKEEIGPNEAARFNEVVDSSLGELLSVAKTTKDKISTAIIRASGGETDMASGMDNMGEPAGMGEPSGMGELGDGFDGDDAVAGNIGPEGREMKGESLDFEDTLLSLKETAKDGKIAKKDFDRIVGKK